MAALPVHIRLFQAVGITTSAAIVGGHLTISFICIPALLQSPSAVVSRQCKTIYERGRTTAIPMAVLSAGSYTYLSYALYKTLHHPRAEIYGLAAVCTICMVPFTSIVMGSNIGKLEEKAKESQEWSIADEKVENRAAKGESSKELLDYWATLNVVGGLFPLVGAAFGAWATLK